MPRYTYTAIAADGKKAKGTVSAESPYAARKQLRIRNIHPTSVTETGAAEEGKTAFFSIFSRTSKKTLIDFTRQMATLLNSGIKLTEAMTVLTMQAPDSKFKAALTDIRDRVITGESLTDAMKDYEDYFDIIYISMVRVGEVTGSLGPVFGTIGNFMGKRQKVESKIVTAMVYPVILMIFAVVVILILTTFVIPKIGAQLIAAKQDLPWITKRLMNVSYIMTSWWVLLVIAAIIGMVWGAKRFFATPRGAFMRDKFLLSLPMFGPLIKQRVVARFASTLSTLLGSGLSMAESFRVVGEVTGNTLMKRAIDQSRERILSGADIATPLRESGVIDPSIAHMVTVGEKSGELESMLKNISDSLEESTDIVIERLSAAVEPVVIVFIAVVVGIIALAIMLPILKISQMAM